MANPFEKITQNANQSQKKWDKRDTSDLEGKKCKGCGAARPKDTNLTTCDYCGYKFMDIDNEIRTDK